MDTIIIRENFYKVIKQAKGSYIHIIIIGTKPDIIKQFPLYFELVGRNEPVLVIHTGQHYDYNLSDGMLEEIELTPDVNLKIEGTYFQKLDSIIRRLGYIFDKVQESGAIPVPYIHGDTLTAMASSLLAWIKKISCIHVEAGIRSFRLKRKYYQRLLEGDYSFNDWRKMHLSRKFFEREINEPYPEQFNTRSIAPTAKLHLAPVEIAAQNLIAEGFPNDNIIVVGNTITDSLQFISEKENNSRIFDSFPKIKNGFIHFSVHRQENCSCEARFKAIWGAIENLVHQGKIVLMISLNATKSAIRKFNLTERLNKIKRESNFIYSDIWDYYSDVITAMKRASICVTDSGTMQEEMNILGIPTATIGFCSDRPETLHHGCNIIAPPISSEIITKIVIGAEECTEMKSKGNIYGEQVSSKCIDEILNLLSHNERLFNFYKV